MEKAKEILQKYWGFPDFRPQQKNIVEHVIGGNSALALLPTGGGKSICFQVPALVQEGICIVISPLLALMRDQVTQLKNKKIQAEYIHSAMSGTQIDTVLDNCVYGNIKFLYISPERLQGVLVAARLAKMKVNLIAIDEAHCISQWGHDFRPAYQKIHSLIQMHPQVPVIALTATATQKVVEDILETIGKGKMKFFRSSFARTNIEYAVYKAEDKLNALIQLIKKNEGCGIVYLRSRKNVEKYSKELNKNGISADYYHAGLINEDRKKVEKEWMDNYTRVVVSTNAFGMGIDKPDVRWVIHCDIPNNLEEYYQESGRAGRDGLASKAIVIYNQEDIEFQELMLDYNFPTKKEIEQVYQSISNYYKVAVGDNKGKGFPFDIYKFCAKTKLEPRKVFSAIKILEKEGYFFLTDNELNSSKVKITCNQFTLQNEVQKSGLPPKVLNFLLRSYTGLFNDFIKIQESKIASALNVSEQEVKNAIQKLSFNHILQYYMQSFLPVLIYTTECLPVSHLTISAKNLSSRRAVAQQQLRAMINFVSEEEKCRTNIALFYFNELPEKDCGHCDNCLKNQKVKGLKNIVLEHLTQPKNLNDLIILLPQHKSQIIQTLRELLEDKKVKREGEFYKIA
jgi:ATP-dependent DNA helicase RecQ